MAYFPVLFYTYECKDKTLKTITNLSEQMLKNNINITVLDEQKQNICLTYILYQICLKWGTTPTELDLVIGLVFYL